VTGAAGHDDAQAVQAQLTGLGGETLKPKAFAERFGLSEDQTREAVGVDFKSGKNIWLVDHGKVAPENIQRAYDLAGTDAHRERREQGIQNRRDPNSGKGHVKGLVQEKAADTAAIPQEDRHPSPAVAAMRESGGVELYVEKARLDEFKADLKAAGAADKDRIFDGKGKMWVVSPDIAAALAPKWGEANKEAWAASPDIKRHHDKQASNATARTDAVSRAGPKAGFSSGRLFVDLEAADRGKTGIAAIEKIAKGSKNRKGNPAKLDVMIAISERLNAEHQERFESTLRSARTNVAVVTQNGGQLDVVSEHRTLFGENAYRKHTSTQLGIATGKAVLAELKYERQYDGTKPDRFPSIDAIKAVLPEYVEPNAKRPAFEMSKSDGPVMPAAQAEHKAPQPERAAKVNKALASEVAR